MRTRLLMLVSFLLLVLLPAAPAQAIVNGEPDNGAHPYVGQLLFYVPDDVDPRFTDPGSWYTCSGTLMDAQTVLSAGHCTYGVGENGESTIAGGGDGSGGNDVWISFEEEPDFSILPPSSGFVPDDNEARYDAWSSALDSSPTWHRATSYPHDLYDPAAFFLHDAGVLELHEAQPMSTYGQLPTLGLLDTLVKDKSQRFTAVGYGLEGAGQHTAVGGDTRMVAELQLVNLNGAYGIGKGVAAKFSNNSGQTHTGGTCFGDSGGPILRSGTNVVTAVVSFGVSVTCSDGTGGYRLDQADDLSFLSPFIAG